MKRKQLVWIVLSVLIPGWSAAQQEPADSLLLRGCHYFRQVPQPEGRSGPTGLACGSNARSDSLDVLHYDVTVDLTAFAQEQVTARCAVTFTPLQAGITALPLDLLDLTVDSVWLDGVPADYNYDGLLLDIPLPVPADPGDTLVATVHYHGHPTADPSGFGGLVFENGIAYNLGIGLSSNPYNFGRSWHPCFDNFVERATYDIRLVTNDGRKGYAIGALQAEIDLGDGKIRRDFHMGQPLPTYLVGLAASQYAEVHQNHTGQYGDHPILLVGKPGDTTAMKTAFSYLGQAVDALESWFGPYIWGQVGYVMTVAGAMEHSSLIAYPDFIIDQGASFSMNRLMAHELGHHWWGNITTLSCPSDMWIKEGNAEYSAHLFTEYAFGRDAFVKQVKDNHYGVVLRQAHIEDQGYWPLSGLPYEHTYGTHTYNKGASVMHNLRGYLGDSLFQSGMRQVLVDLTFQSMDAATFRDKLTEVTGVDLAPFFNGWIFQPGFALYELDSVKVEPTAVPEVWQATVYIEQKLRAASEYHEAVPLELTFFDAQRASHTTTVTASGPHTTAVVDIPFEPVWQVLNDGNRLNLGRMQHRTLVTETGNLNLPYCDVSNFEVLALPDTALVSFIHYWGAPDPMEPNPTGVVMSGTHYWRFGGILPAGFKAKVLLPYKGTNPDDFDHDLLSAADDSLLILVWRPRPGVPWGKYPYYRRTALGSTNGIMRVDTLLPGDYAFASGTLPLATAVSAGRRPDPVRLEAFPNPTAGALTVSWPPMVGEAGFLEVSDLTGRFLARIPLDRSAGQVTVAAGDWPAGTCLLSLKDSRGHILGRGRVVVLP